MKQLIVISTAILLASCSKFLEEQPKEIAAERYFTTAAEMEAAVYAIYEPLQAAQTSFGRHYHTIQESQTDYGSGRGSYSAPSTFQGLDATNISRVSNIWANFYLAIRNANLVIGNEGRALGNGVDAARVSELVAEAKFMRSLVYFYLVRNWGGVPLRDETNMDQQALARSPVEAVYGFIEADLTQAEANLPEQSAMAGRPNRYTAKAVLADVYLFQDKWTDARDKAKEVIDAEVYQLLEITQPEDYRKIFGYDVTTTTEEVFYLKFTGTKASNFTFMLHHPSSPYYGGSGAFGLYTDAVSMPTIAEWDDDDFRKTFNLYPQDIGVGSPTTLLYRKFIEPDPTAGLSSDYPMYRYAEILLIFAEADAMASGVPTAAAVEYLNQVRRRAYGHPTALPSPVDYTPAGLSLDDFRQQIADERMYELFCEGKRFLDLKRMGLLQEQIQYAHGKTVAEKQLLWPIPNTEFNYNDLIDETVDQNPGY